MILAELNLPVVSNIEPTQTASEAGDVLRGNPAIIRLIVQLVSKTKIIMQTVCFFFLS